MVRMNDARSPPMAPIAGKWNGPEMRSGMTLRAPRFPRASLARRTDLAATASRPRDARVVERVGGAVEADLGELVAEDPVGLLEDRPRAGGRLVDRAAHADALRALTGEDEREGGGHEHKANKGRATKPFSLQSSCSEYQDVRPAGAGATARADPGRHRSRDAARVREARVRGPADDRDRATREGLDAHRVPPRAVEGAVGA